MDRGEVGRRKKEGGTCRVVREWVGDINILYEMRKKMTLILIPLNKSIRRAE